MSWNCFDCLKLVEVFIKTTSPIIKICCVTTFFGKFFCSAINFLLYSSTFKSETICGNPKALFWKSIHKMFWKNWSQTLFWKIKIGLISWSTVSIFTQFIFIVFWSWRLPKYIVTKVLTTCFNRISFSKKQ